MSDSVLGIDPSLTATGIASSAGWTHTEGMEGKRDWSYPERLTRLNIVAAAVCNCVVPRRTGLVVLEGPAYSRGADPSAHERAALWWLIYRGCRMRDVPVAVVTPGQLKVYATGKGTASKGAIVDAIARRWPQFQTEGDANLADAITLMVMGLDHLGRVTPMPQTHRRALERVDWPETGGSQ